YLLNPTIKLINTFFFIQAEDGIRDFHVTGVQTCALPILRSIRFIPKARHESIRFVYFSLLIQQLIIMAKMSAAKLVNFIIKSKRSEERRVGKEIIYRVYR